MKEKYIKIFILIVTLLSCIFFLMEHFSVDTYNLVNSGYKEYAKWFANSGRYISSSLLLILYILKINYGVAIFVLSLISILIYMLSSIKIYKYLNNINNNNQLITLIAIITLSFNFCILQTLHYFENISMAIAFYMGVSASILMQNDNKKDLIKSFLYILIGTFCYQGTISIYIPLVILFWLINNSKKSLKDFFVFLIKAASVYAISFIINYIGIKITNKSLMQTSRVNGDLDILASILFPIESIKFVIVDSCGMLKYHIYPITLLSIIIILVYSFIKIYKNKKCDEIIINIIYIFILGIAVYYAGFLPVMMLPKDSHSVSARLLPTIGASIAIIYTYIYYYLDIKNINKLIKNILNCLIIFWFTINIINNMYVGMEAAKNFKLVKSYTSRIEQSIDKYEKENNKKIIKLNKITVNKYSYFDDIKFRNEVNYNPYSVDWVGIAPLNIFEKRYINFVEKDIKDIDFKINKNEIIFKNDEVYIYI